MRAMLLILTLVAMTCAGAVGCFNPSIPEVAFRCGDGGLCPEDYECRPDGCCHKIGSPADEHGQCLVEQDAAVSMDASITADASP